MKGLWILQIICFLYIYIYIYRTRHLQVPTDQGNNCNCINSSATLRAHTPCVIDHCNQWRENPSQRKVNIHHMFPLYSFSLFFLTVTSKRSYIQSLRQNKRIKTVSTHYHNLTGEKKEQNQNTFSWAGGSCFKIASIDIIAWIKIFVSSSMQTKSPIKYSEKMGVTSKDMKWKFYKDHNKQVAGHRPSLVRAKSPSKHIFATFGSRCAHKPIAVTVSAANLLSGSLI